MDVTYLHLTSLGVFREKNIIKTEHLNSLIGGSGYYRLTDAVLNEWLGFNGKVTMIDTIDDTFEGLSMDENQSTPEDHNEEQDEEERRRDEIDVDEDFFRPRKIAPKINLISNDDDNEWQTVVNKTKQKQIIHQLLTLPTKLNDQKVDMISNDLWTLTIAERHDLYRYWLYKYREKGYKSVSNAHLEFNQAVAEYSQYMQLEDYYILKNAIIIAMTTTCAAKYFDVLQKLGKKYKTKSYAKHFLNRVLKYRDSICIFSHRLYRNG